MATIPEKQNIQGTLSVGTNSLISAPNRYRVFVSFVFNNPIAYDITLTINRSNQGSSLQAYSLTLDAGDTLNDTGYELDPYDSIVVDTATAGTNYFMSVTNVPYSATS
jgi:hypothetical protein